jgi:hypothetical protein
MASLAGLSLFALIAGALISDPTSAFVQYAQRAGRAHRALDLRRAMSESAGHRLRPAGGLRMGKVPDGARAEDTNEAMRMLRSRRFFVQTTAAGAASLALGGGVLSPVNSPAFAEDAAAALAGGVVGAPVYDLGIGKDYNRAPGKLIVMPPNTVEKSPADDKEYRALTLANGLRVLLASDPKADTAAAALNVRVGHFSDPDDVPGLAHFCEHMLFLGTKKFPQEVL